MLHGLYMKQINIWERFILKCVPYAIPSLILTEFRFFFMHRITMARNKMKATMLMDRVMISVSLVSVGAIRKQD